jgi:hypothetical protein
MNLKPWREIAVPHEDVLKDTFQQAEFAADLSRVHAGTATPEYQNPSLFFQRTFITEGMRLPGRILDDWLRPPLRAGSPANHSGRGRSLSGTRPRESVERHVALLPCAGH